MSNLRMSKLRRWYFTFLEPWPGFNERVETSKHHRLQLSSDSQRNPEGDFPLRIFEVVFVLLVTAIGTSLFEAAARFAQAPLQVVLKSNSCMQTS